MKKLYCMNCGTEIKGGIPNECSCGAEFDLADTKNIKRIITSIIFFVILMSPLLILIHFGRQYLQASIILYALLLILGIFWCRIVQTILVRLGLVTLKLNNNNNIFTTLLSRKSEKVSCFFTL